MISLMERAVIIATQSVPTAISNKYTTDAESTKTVAADKHACLSNKIKEMAISAGKQSAISSYGYR